MRCNRVADVSNNQAAMKGTMWQMSGTSSNGLSTLLEFLLNKIVVKVEYYYSLLARSLPACFATSVESTHRGMEETDWIYIYDVGW